MKKDLLPGDKFAVGQMVTQTWAREVVLEVPHVLLSQWSAFICGWPDEAKPFSTHLVGYRAATGKSRASSAVVRFDPETRRAVTASGRVYELVGPPDPQSDAIYIRSEWFSVNGGRYVRDATSDFSA